MRLHNKIVLCVAVGLCLVSCRSTEKLSSTALTVTNHAATKDTTARVDSSAQLTMTTDVHSMVVTDSAIGVAGTDVEVTVTDSLDIDTTVREGNASVHVYSDGKGHKKIDCKTDSLTIVVNNLVRENDYLTKSIQDYVSQNAMSEHSEIKDSTVTERSAVSEVRKGFSLFGGLWRLLGALLVGVICGYLLRMFYKL